MGSGLNYPFGRHFFIFEVFYATKVIEIYQFLHRTPSPISIQVLNRKQTKLALILIHPEAFVTQGKSPVSPSTSSLRPNSTPQVDTLALCARPALELGISRCCYATATTAFSLSILYVLTWLALSNQISSLPS